VSKKKKPAKKIPKLTKQYYVDFYDAFDGWGGLRFVQGIWPERLFDDLEAARTCKEGLNRTLAIGNKSMGEHYGIISRVLGHEIECNYHGAA